jgi:hypothetical protein
MAGDGFAECSLSAIAFELSIPVFDVTGGFVAGSARTCFFRHCLGLAGNRNCGWDCKSVPFLFRTFGYD